MVSFRQVGVPDVPTCVEYTGHVQGSSSCEPGNFRDINRAFSQLFYYGIVAIGL